jgi:four helix bundle protein
LELPNKKYDLEERSALFAERVRDFCLKLPKNPANDEYILQLLRAGASPGANYIEANETIGDKDFKMKIRTCRRESKESRHWLGLVITNSTSKMENERVALMQEAKELLLIFNAILKSRDQK